MAHAFARIAARERRASHGPNSRVCWSPEEPTGVQPPFPQDIWTLSSSVIRLALIGAVGADLVHFKSLTWLTE